MLYHGNLKTMTITAVSKATFNLGQEVYREGTLNEYVYFTTAGEFEISKETIMEPPSKKLSVE